MAVCCEDPAVPSQQSTGSSYCTNGAGGATDGACFPNDGRCSAAFPATETANWCCAASGDFGSNDCPSEQHHCGLLCTTQPCESGGGAPDASTSCPDGWLGTWQLCTGDVSGCLCSDLPSSECITPDVYASYTASTYWGGSPPFPEQCLAAGSSGCVRAFWDGSSGATSVIAPCCPGLTCVFDSACGGSPEGCNPSLAEDPCEQSSGGRCVGTVTPPMTILTDDFSTFSSADWNTVTGTPVLDGAAGAPAPSVQVGNGIVDIVSTTMFPSGVYTVSTDVSIDLTTTSGAEIVISFGFAGVGGSTISFLHDMTGPHADIACGTPASVPLPALDSAWHHWTLTYDGIAGMYTCWWDGVPMGTRPSIGAPPWAVEIYSGIQGSVPSSVSIHFDNVRVTSP